LQHTPNGVLLVDAQTCIRFVNPAFRTMFQCADDELLGRPAKEFVHSDCFDRAIATGGRLMVKENIAEHGISFRVGVFPIEGQDLYCGIFIDISEGFSSISLKKKRPERTFVSSEHRRLNVPRR
jgi:PAS domain S-box-containing protein